MLSSSATSAAGDTADGICTQMQDFTCGQHSGFSCADGSGDGCQC